MAGGWFPLRRRAVVLILTTALLAGGFGGWTVQLARLYSEAPILAFGNAGQQLQRLSVLLAAYWAVDALLLFLTVRFAWLAGRELRSGRRKREAERLFEN